MIVYFSGQLQVSHLKIKTKKELDEILNKICETITKMDLPWDEEARACTSSDVELDCDVFAGTEEPDANS